MEKERKTKKTDWPQRDLTLAALCSSVLAVPLLLAFCILPFARVGGVNSAEHTLKPLSLVLVALEKPCCKSVLFLCRRNTNMHMQSSGFVSTRQA